MTTALRSGAVALTAEAERRAAANASSATWPKIRALEPDRSPHALLAAPDTFNRALSRFRAG